MSNSSNRSNSFIIGKLSAAVALALGAAYDPMGLPAQINKGKHRVPSESKRGRQYVSRSYHRYLGRLFVSARNKGGGARETARRQRQIAADRLHPLYRGAEAT